MARLLALVPVIASPASLVGPTTQVEATHIRRRYLRECLITQIGWLERIDSVIRFEKRQIKAAERQLRALSFEGRDSVSVHMLGWAAREIFDRSIGSW
jgi:hypothetical protein